jgi:hypothetical protein
MIDNAAILFFSGLIVYTGLRAIKLDRIIPWFSDKPLQQFLSLKKGMRK